MTMGRPPLKDASLKRENVVVRLPQWIIEALNCEVDSKSLTRTELIELSLVKQLKLKRKKRVKKSE